MRRTPESSQSRGGFTLVELLVVITIIGILAALISGAVIKALAKGDELKLRNEISQLSLSVNAFKTKYQASFLPGGFLAKRDYNLGNANDVVYLQYLRSIWPRIGTPIAGNMIRVDWGVANATLQATPSGIFLDGNQCLVLFLGGVGGIFGVSDDNQNPFAGANPRPSYEFSPDRLKADSGSPFPRYLDIYGIPYVYFTSGRSGNDYPTTSSAGGTVVIPASVTVGSVTYTVYPFQLSGAAPNVGSNAQRIWANRTSFQIISAGKDSQFHELVAGQYAGGLLWDGGGGGTDISGADNMANFHPALLGVPSN